MEDCLNQIKPKDVYVQCQLRRNVKGGVSVRVAWLPAKYAVKNSCLKVLDKGGWSDGWIVYRVYSKRIGVPDVRQQIRHHRRATGDSLPKEHARA